MTEKLKEMLKTKEDPTKDQHVDQPEERMEGDSKIDSLADDDQVIKVKTGVFKIHSSINPQEFNGSYCMIQPKHQVLLSDETLLSFLWGEEPNDKTTPESLNSIFNPESLNSTSLNYILCYSLDVRYPPKTHM